MSQQLSHSPRWSKQFTLRDLFVAITVICILAGVGTHSLLLTVVLAPIITGAFLCIVNFLTAGLVSTSGSTTRRVGRCMDAPVWAAFAVTRQRSWSFARFSMQQQSQAIDARHPQLRNHLLVVPGACTFDERSRPAVGEVLLLPSFEGRPYTTPLRTTRPGIVRATCRWPIGSRQLSLPSSKRRDNWRRRPPTISRRAVPIPFGKTARS